MDKQKRVMFGKLGRERYLYAWVLKQFMVGVSFGAGPYHSVQTRNVKTFGCRLFLLMAVDVRPRPFSF